MVAVVSSRHRIAKGAINTLYSLVVNSNDQSSQNHLSSICYVSCDIRTMWYGVGGGGVTGITAAKHWQRTTKGDRACGAR